MSGAVKPPFSVCELDHVVLRVQDVELVRQFYCEVLGCTEERRLDDLGLVQLRAGQSLIDLVDVKRPLGRAGGKAPGGEGRNLEHFCLRIDPFDEAAIRTHLSSFNIDFKPAETRYGAHGFGPSIYITDPENNTIELKG